MENKQLSRAYNKRFNQLSKLLTKVPTACMVLFVEHLKYLRDTCIMAEPNISENTSLTTLMVAIGEFEAYLESEDTKQKEFHWKIFCEFLKLNMEEWLVLNDSV